MKKLIILAASFALVASFAMTAAAAEWNFYGSARISTFVSDIEIIDGADVSDDYAQGLQGNSRIGANVKVSDELSGRFEYGTGVNVRLLYGEWNFGSGKLLVGQTYSPLNMFYSNQVYGSDTDLLNTGGVYSGREQILQLTFGSFKVALVPTNRSISGAIAAFDPTLTVSSTESDIPAIEAKYSLSFDNVKLALAGGYQTFDLTITDGVTSADTSSDAYVLALGASANFGAFYAKGNIYMGQNAGSLIWTGGTFGGLGIDEVEADNMGYVVVLGFKANDMFAFEAGYGYSEAEYDDLSFTDEVQAYYLQSTITLAPGVMVIPEVGVIDNEEAGQTENTYFGAKWQINF